MPIMIWLAIIIEFAIQNWIDAGILLGIQFANATLGWCGAAARLPRQPLPPLLPRALHAMHVHGTGFTVPSSLLRSARLLPAPSHPRRAAPSLAA